MPEDFHKEKRNFTELIKSIYLYLFTSIGLILFIVGVFQASSFTVNKIFFPHYYLGYEENRCDVGQYFAPAKIEGIKPLSPQDQRAQDEKCLKRLEEFRRYKEVTDVALALTFIAIGSIVFVFHLRRTTLLTKR